MSKRSIEVLSAVAMAGLMVMATSAAAADLTPEGGDRAASADGLVPAYTGKQAPEPGWSYGKYRGDFWKHKNEKPLYSIDASNVAKYASMLSAGQIQLIKQTKGYRMDVYPSHRECQLPDFAAENSKANLTAAKLDASGENVQTAVLPGVPFPEAKTGAEAIQNYLLRYHGEGIDWPQMITVVSPRPGASEWIEAVSQQNVYYPWAKPGKTSPQDVDQLSQGVFYDIQSPAAEAGQAYVARNYFNRDAETYYYFPGQRRVRRMPAYTHDAPIIGMENEYLVDEANMFYGMIDRFSWKLVGKKEMIVPYNSFGMYKFGDKLHDVFTPNGIAPDNRRYEVHRVWEVEATLKPTDRHVASKKVLYLDEDTWLALVGEDYDAQGKLWKLRESYPIPSWELGGACDNLPFVQYNLIDGRYLSDQTTIGQGKDVRWYETINAPHFKTDFFTAESLRSVSER